jgi:peptidoglycan/LPS O-acetylase OafA/YrhL
VVAACCVVELLLGPYDGGPSVWRRGFWTLTYVSNWVWAFTGGDELGALNAPWSLAIEEQFYLFWPIALLALLRAGLDEVTVALAVLAVALSTVVLEWRLTRNGASWWRTYAGTDVRGGVILLGCTFALLMPKMERHLPRAILPAIEVACAALLMFMLSSGYLHSPGRLAYFHRLEAGVFTLGLVAVAVFGNRGVVNRFLSLPPLVYIGRISYGIYRWHGSANLYLARYAPNSPVWVRIACGLVLAVVSYHLVELYFLRRKDRWSKSSLSAERTGVAAAMV